MENTQVALLVSLIRGARDHTLDIVKSVPDTHHFKQLAPGKATPLWLLGHLTRTVDKLLLEWTLQTDPIMSEKTGIRFAPEHAGGTAPTTDPEDYPSWEALMAAYVEATESAMTGLLQLNDSDLEKPVPGDMPDAYRVRFPNIGSVCKLLIAHDGYHRGQMGMIAKMD
ncbi:MAG: DinB family protein [Candidatus Hydrogenedentes bacterium]|nr:DinB family protein [Candidatus Hydrogenedentota bacterium]